LLFLRCGGFIFFSFGGQDLRQKGRFLRISPFFSIMFFFSSLSLCGFPFLSGFYSKDLILESSFGLGWGFLCLIIFFFSCMMSLIYRIRLFFYGLSYFRMIISFIIIRRERISVFFIYFLGS